MAIMIKLITTVLAATIAAAAALPGPELGGLATRNASTEIEGGFVKHCSTHTVGRRGEIVGRLIGQCGDDELYQHLHPTWLDLTLCLGNDGGELHWRDEGNAMDSCVCHSRKFDTQWIECQCLDEAGGEWKDTSLDLNEGIRYDMDFHVLACFENIGVFDGPAS